MDMDSSLYNDPQADKYTHHHANEYADHLELLEESQDSQGPTSADAIYIPELVDPPWHPVASRKRTDKGFKTHSPAETTSTTTLPRWRNASEYDQHHQITATAGPSSTRSTSASQRSTRRNHTTDTTENKRSKHPITPQGSRGTTSADATLTPELVDPLWHPVALGRGTDKGSFTYSPPGQQQNTDHSQTTFYATSLILLGTVDPSLKPTLRGTGSELGNNASMDMDSSLYTDPQTEDYTYYHDNEYTDHLELLEESQVSQGPTSADAIYIPELVDSPGILWHPEEGRTRIQKPIPLGLTT